MKTRTAVALTALVVGGGQAAVWVLVLNARDPRPVAADTTASTDSPAATPRPATTPSHSLPAGTTLTEAATARPAATSQTTDPTSKYPHPLPSTVLNHPTTPRPSNHDAPISRAELERRALAVQQATDQRLRQLASSLDLTPGQQDYLFDVIARHNPNFHPSFAIGTVTGDGTTTPVADDTTAQPPLEGNVNDEIYDVLTTDQQDDLTEELIDRTRWWDDILDELVEEHDELMSGNEIVPDTTATTGSGSGNNSGPTPSVTTGDDGATTGQQHGGGNLFDLLRGGN